MQNIEGISHGQHQDGQTVGCLVTQQGSFSQAMAKVYAFNFLMRNFANCVKIRLNCYRKLMRKRNLWIKSEKEI
jgi:hypothetical protein